MVIQPTYSNQFCPKFEFKTIPENRGTMFSWLIPQTQNSSTTTVSAAGQRARRNLCCKTALVVHFRSIGSHDVQRGSSEQFHFHSSGELIETCSTCSVSFMMVLLLSCLSCRVEDFSWHPGSRRDSLKWVCNALPRLHISTVALNGCILFIESHEHQHWTELL